MGILLGLSLALLAVQGDLGAALLLFAISLGMLYLASSRLDYVLAGLLAFAAGAYLLHGRIVIVANRVSIWLDPWSDAHGSGYPHTGSPIRPNIVSRIIQVADVYDSLTNAGARIKPFSRSRALAIIDEKAGIELDPLLCRIFIDLALAMPGRAGPAKFA